MSGENIRATLKVVASAALTSGLAFSGGAVAGVSEALTGGKVSIDVRYRYEWVDQAGIANEAKASTVRTRLGYVTGEYAGFRAFVEMENTSRVGGGDYTVPGASPHGPKASGYPVVADPIFTELNQAWLEYATAQWSTRVRYGRQRVTLDNHRFIGNVGWRQNEQTYDAFTLGTSPAKGLRVFYGYFTNANTVVGTNRRMRSHIVNVAYAGLPFAKVTGYGYFLDFESGTDTRTLGLRITGKRDLGGVAVLYTLEYARQRDYQDSSGIDAKYHRIEVGAKVRGVVVKVGQELLGGDGTYGFQTPLATLHAMNGWADKFLSTPANGLDDRYVLVGGSLAGSKLKAVYHDFSADTGGSDYGTELDLVATRRIGKRFTVGAKYASYEAEGYATDTDKLWLWGQMKF